MKKTLISISISLILILSLIACDKANIENSESQISLVSTIAESSDESSLGSSSGETVSEIESIAEESSTENISNQGEASSMITSSQKTPSKAPTASISKPELSSAAFLDNYDTRKNSLVMEIGAWYSPVQTDAAFKEYAAAGFTTVFLQGVNAGRIDDYDKVKQGLELSHKYEIKAYVWADFKSIRNNLEFTHNFSSFPAFAGLVYDEPTKSEIDTYLSPSVPTFNQMYPDDAMYVNLYPLRGTHVSQYDTYSDYLEATYSKVISRLKGPKWLSVDDYPIMENNVTENGVTKRKKYINDLWLKNIEYVAEFAKKDNDLKTHFFIQTMGYGLNNRQPTEADVRLQVYGLLAFGIDSYSAFCYCTPGPGGEFSEQQYAMIKRDGSKSDLYHSVSKVNHEILNFDHVYYQFNWKGVYCVDSGERNNAFNNLSKALNLASLKDIKNLSANEDVLVGYFQDNSGRPGYIVTNYNETSLDLTAKLKMEFKSATRVAVYRNGQRKIYNLNNNTYEVILAAGEGAFIIPF